MSTRQEYLHRGTLLTITFVVTLLLVLRQNLQDLNANVAAGHAVNNPSVAVSFPTDNSKASQLARIQTALVTLQNLNGPGVGCPAVSTTFLAQQTAIQNGTPAPVAASPAAAAAPAASPAVAAVAPAAGGVDSSLIPQFGFSAGVNPTGTGDCDGAVNGANGQPIKIPCTCPPDRNTFIAVRHLPPTSGAIPLLNLLHYL